MALKDRLEARRRPEAGHPVRTDTTLSVLAGAREEPKAATPAVREEAVPKSAGLTTTLAAAKAAIHAQLVERHADEIDITDREGVRSRITTLAEEYVKTAGIALNRLDRGTRASTSRAGFRSSSARSGCRGGTIPWSTAFPTIAS